MQNLVSLACVLLTWADPPAPSPPTAPAMDLVTAMETVLADAIARAAPSVVAIAREKSEHEETTAIRGRNPEPPADPTDTERVSFDYGSGVVIGDGGEILTAYHVVKWAKRLLVWANDRQGFEAEIIAADPRSDLAVIVPRRRSPDLPPPRLRPLPIGDAGKLRKGSFLLALGNPYNSARDGSASASWGILSNIARRLEPSYDEKHKRLRYYPTLLQLDAKLNLGMSGAAVINLKGELVGITTAAASVSGFDAQAGYAIPMDLQGRRIIEALKQGKEYEYGFLGIALDQSGSNRVASAQLGTPAAEGDVLTDDAILAVGETPVRDSDDLVLAINALPAGTRVKLRILRRNEVIQRSVELAKLRVDGDVIATNRPQPWRGLRVDYTSTLPNATFGPDLLTAMAGGGVAIVEVEPSSPAETAGLKRGQVVKSVEGRVVRNPHDFARAVSELSGPARLVTDLGPVTVAPK
jgi:S1-C subfamily serine protease